MKAGRWHRGIVAAWLCGILMGSITTGTAAAWTEAQVKELLADAQKVEALSGNEVLDGGTALFSAGKQKEASEILSTWVTASDKYKALSTEQIDHAAGILFAQPGDKVQSARKHLADLVSSTYLADADKVRTVGIGTWAALSSRLRNDLAKDQMDSWIRALRSAYVEDASVFGPMGIPDLKNLADALAALGDSKSGLVAAAWVDATAAWQKFKPLELTSFLGEIRRGGKAALPQCSRLIDYIETTHMADARTIRSLGAQTWWDWACRLQGEFSKEQRAIWIDRLRMAYVNDEAVLGGMKPGDLNAIVRALSDAGDGKAQRVVASWFEKTSAWQEMKPAELLSVMEGLQRCGDTARSQRTQLAGHLTAKYFADGKTVYALGVNPCASMVDRMADVLSQEQRVQWVASIRGAFAAAAPVKGQSCALKTLDLQSEKWLYNALASLDDPQAPRLMADWFDASAQWQKLKPEGLTAVMNGLLLAGEVGLAQRRRLIDFIATTYLADAKNTRSVRTEAWWFWARGLKADLTKNRQAAWLSALRSAYADDASVLKALSFGDVKYLSKALSELGDKQSPQVVAAWFDQNESEWTKLKPQDFTGFFGELRSCGDMAKSQRERLIQYIEKTCLKDANAVRSVEPQTWWDWTVRLGNDLSEQQRAAWRAAVRAAYVEGASSLEKLSPAAMNSVANALSGLGDEKARTVAVDWFNRVNDLGRLKPDEITAVIGGLRASGDASRPQRKLVAEHLEKTYLKDARTIRAVGAKTWSHWAGGLKTDLTEGQRRQWIGDLRWAYVEDASALWTLAPEDLARIVAALHSLGDDRAPEVVIDWFENPVAWQELKLPGLVCIADELRRCGDAGPQTRQLAAQVESRYLGDPGAMRKAGIGPWSALLDRLNSELSPEQEGKWAGALESAFVDDPGLSAVTAQRLAVDLGRLGTSAAVVRQKLGDVVSKKFLSGAEAARSVDVGTWKSLAASLAGDLRPATRAAWLAGLDNAFVKEKKVFSSLKLDAACTLRDALNLLGSPQASALVVQWAGCTESWKELEPDGLARLSTEVLRAGDAGNALRRQVAEYVDGKYFADAKTLRAPDLKQCADRVGLGRGSFAAAERAVDRVASLRLCGRQRRCGERTASSVTALELQQVKWLDDALTSLGDTGGSTAMADWAKGTNWFQHANVALF